VDTHVGRLVRRFGWTQEEDAVKVEKDLMHLVPPQEWLSLAHHSAWPYYLYCSEAALCAMFSSRSLSICNRMLYGEA
jgi:endonuclease III